MYNISQFKKLRLGNGMTQKQVADCLHMDRSTYAYYELGQTKPTIEFLLGLARLYGISLNELLCEPPAQERRDSSDMLFSRLSRDEQSLVILFRAMNPEQRKIFISSCFLC